MLKNFFPRRHRHTLPSDHLKQPHANNNVLHLSMRCRSSRNQASRAASISAAKKPGHFLSRQQRQSGSQNTNACNKTGVTCSRKKLTPKLLFTTDNTHQINADPRQIFYHPATADRKGGLSMPVKKKAPAKKAPAKKAPAKKVAAKKPVKKLAAKKAAPAKPVKKAAAAKPAKKAAPAKPAKKAAAKAKK